jgi:hypothetical protein
MPGDREILDGRYGPSTLLRPLERSKLNRLGRLWNLTDRQIEDLETSLIDSFRGAELARQLDGRLPSVPDDKQAIKRSESLDKVHEGDIRLMMEEVRSAAAALVHALTRDPKSPGSGSDVAASLWHSFCKIDVPPWISQRNVDVVSRALNAAKDLHTLAEQKLSGVPQSSLPRPKQQDRILDELLRSFGVIWAKFTGDRPPSSPKHIFFRVSASYLRLVGYQVTAKALSNRWSKLIGPNVMKKKNKTQLNFHRSLRDAEGSFLK